MGHAFKNSELNWHWNEYVRDPLKKSNNDTQYIFTATAGEEPFWYCYFTTGPEFFNTFFYSDTVVYATHDENFKVTMVDPLEGSDLKGFAPWGSNVFVVTENGQSCETWADEKNEFFCTFSDNFIENELITANIIAPDGTPYRVQKKQGNAKSLDCALDSGMLGECQVQ